MPRRSGHDHSSPPVPPLTDPYRPLPTLTPTVSYRPLPSLLVSLLALAATGCASLAPPRYHGPVSDHFDGKRFHNYGAGVDDSIVKALKRELQRPKGRPLWRNWQDARYDVPPRRVGGGQVRVTFVNHA